MAGPGTLELAGGRLGVAPIFSASLQLQITGTVALPGPVTFTGLGSLALQGTLAGPGTLTLAAGSTTTAAAGTLLSDGAHLINRGRLSVSSFSNVLDGGSTVENAGTLVLADGADISDSGSGINRVTNDAGATISYSGSDPSQSAGIHVPLTDSGNIAVAHGTLYLGAVTLTGSPADSGVGTVNVNSLIVTSALSLAGPWTLDGQISGGGILTIPAGSVVHASAETLLAGGTRLLNKGSLVIAGGLNELDGGSVLENAGTLTLTDDTEIYDSGSGINQLVNDAGATIGYAGSDASQSATIEAPLIDSGTINVSKGTLVVTDAVLTGSPNDTGAGVVNFQSATVTAALTLSGPWNLTGSLSGGGTLTIPAGSSTSANTTLLLAAGTGLVNDGTLTLSGGGNELDGGAVLENAGTLAFTDNASVSDSGSGDNQLVNDAGATISYTGSDATQSASINLPLTDSGTVTVGQGTLDVELVSGAGRPTFSGAGAVELTGTVSIPSTTVTSGLHELQVAPDADLEAPATGDLVLSPAQFVLGGTVDGPGTVTLGSATSGVFAAGSTLSGGVRLVNSGSLAVQQAGGAVELVGGSIVENTGTVNVEDGADIADYGDGRNRFINDAGATVHYAATDSSQSATIGVPVTDSGTVTVATGTLLLDLVTGSGSPTFTGSGSLALTGTGTLASTTVTSGLNDLQIAEGSTLEAPDTGTLTLNAEHVDIDGTVDGPGAVILGTSTVGTLGRFGSLTGGILLVNHKTLEVQGAGYYPGFKGGSTLENAGTLVLDDSSYLYDGGGGRNKLQNDAGATVTYTGLDSSQSSTIGVALANSGVVSVARGTLTITSLVNLTHGTLTGGSYRAAGGVLYLPTPVTVNAGSITLGATGSILSGGSNALASLARNSGTLVVGQSVTLSSAIANSGSMSVTGGTLAAPAFRQTAGSTTVAAGGTIRVTGTGTPIVISAGVLTGNGTVVGTVSGAGTVTPGRSAGPLTITGGFSPASTATVAIGISGPSGAGSAFGQLAVTGTAALAGTLAITTASSYLPPVGTVITIVTATRVTGTFGAVTGTALSGRHWTVQYSATGVTLTMASG